MPKTIIQVDGELYHKACLADEDVVRGTAVSADEVEDEQVCEDCASPLTGEDAPDDDEEPE